MLEQPSMQACSQSTRNPDVVVLTDLSGCVVILVRAGCMKKMWP